MLKAITYISVTDLPLHCIPFHSSSPPQGSPPLDFQPDNWDGLFMLLNITLSAATEIASQQYRECSEPWPMRCVRRGKNTMGGLADPHRQAGRSWPPQTPPRRGGRPTRRAAAAAAGGAVAEPLRAKGSTARLSWEHAGDPHARHPTSSSSLSWTGGGEECFPKLGNGGGRDGEQKLEGGRRVRPLRQREWREAATLKALPLRVNLLWPAEKNAIYFTMD